LGEWLDRVTDEQIDSQRVHEVAIGMHAGLRYLEQQGVLHLDIKPANVLLDLEVNSEMIRPALCDFDVSLETRVRTTQLIGEKAGLHGTVGYVAPERLKDPLATPTHKADMFSFGVVLQNIYFHPRVLPEAKGPFGDELFGALGELSHDNWAQDAPRGLRNDLLCFEPATRKSASEVGLPPSGRTRRVLVGFCGSPYLCGGA
jgi:serine/threonine protein kinase